MSQNPKHRKMSSLQKTPSDLDRKINQGPVDTYEEIQAQYNNPVSPVDTPYERSYKDKMKTVTNDASKPTSPTPNKPKDKDPEPEANKPFNPNPFSTRPHH
ncbi:MAG TPA: hypothetical protein VHD33_07370 [Legionellaceae bacterium]|nr:hypothetical protein [Legionellaceae bacterium]